MIVVTAAAALVVSYLHYPGGAVLWLGLLLTAMIEPAPLMTGKQIGGGSVPSNDQERKRSRSYQAIRQMRGWLFYPAPLFEEGFPETALIVTAVFGFALALLPLHAIVIHHKDIPSIWLHIGNGVLGALGAFAIYAVIRARRRNPPLITVTRLVSELAARDIVASIVVAGASIGGGAIAGQAYASWLHASASTAIGVDICGAVLFLLSALSMLVRSPIQKEWLATIEAQDYWDGVWPALKLSSTPTITSRKELGDGVNLDSGFIHFSAGPQAIMSNQHIMAATPADVRLFRLYEMEQSGASTTKFALLSWPTNAMPAIGDPNTDPNLVALWFQGNITETLRTQKIEAAIFVSATAIAAPTSEGAVYQLKLTLASATANIDKIYEHRKLIASAVGVPFFIDMANEIIFCGDLEHATYPDDSIAESVNNVFELQQWIDRLSELKLPSPPTMLSHTSIGNGIKIDVGEVHFSVGPQSILSNPHLSASLPADIQLFRLYVPDDADPSTASTTKFQFVSWPTDASPDICDPECDTSIAKLWIEGVITEGMRAYGIETGVFVDELEPIFGPTSPTAAWSVRVTLTGSGLSLENLGSQADMISSMLGAKFIVSSSDEIAFCGDFQNTIYADPDTEEVIDLIEQENQWAYRWRTILNNPNDPHCYLDQLEAKRIETIDGGRFRLDVLPCSPRLSIPPSDFFGKEEQLATMLDSAPMVSIVPFLVADRQNGGHDRHKRAFLTVWSKYKDIPTDPSRLKDDSAIAARNGGKSALGSGAKYIFWWRINRVFRGLGMEIPDVYDAKVLNEEEKGKPNIWVIRIKTYGKVKFDGIVGAQTKLEQAFQCEWLRVRATSVGADLYVGPNQNVMAQIYPTEILDIVDDLDWEHAWRVARITGPDLSVPVKIEGVHPPYNSRVTEYRFELPRGFTPSKVRAQVDTLKTAAGLSFIDMSEVSDSPNELRVIASRESPLPSMVPMDFEAVDHLQGEIPLGVSVTGEIVNFNRDNTPHLLVVGATGTGKAQPLDEEIPVPISERFPQGVATIGELEVGDLVWGREGRPIRITALSPIQDEKVYSVIFDSGHVIRCSGEHLWRVTRPRPEPGSGESMVDAVGIMNIAQPVKEEPSLSADYRVEIGMLARSFVSSDPTMRAVLTTKYVKSLIDKDISVIVRSGAPVRGELPSYFDMSPQEIVDALLRADNGWLETSGLQLLVTLEEEARRSIVDELLRRLVVDYNPPWVGIRKDAGTLAYDMLVVLAGSLSIRILDDPDNGYTYFHRHVGVGGGLLFHTVIAIEEETETVAMRCLGVDSEDHCYLAKGFIPTHNSVLTRTLIYGSLINGDRVYIIDPMKRATDLLAFKPYTHGFTTTNSRVEALGYLNAIYAEIKRRQEINHQYGAENGLSPSIPPEDRYPFMLVELDEFAQLMAETNIPRNQVSSDPSQNQAYIDAEIENNVIFQIGQLVGAIAAVARSTLVTLIIATQRMDSAFLDKIPQGTNLKTNLGRVLLGGASLGERMSALRNVDTTPRVPVDAPKGRAVYEPVIGRGMILQSWYSPPSAIQEALAERLTPVPPEDKLNPYAYVPAEMMNAASGEGGSPISTGMDTGKQTIDDDEFNDEFSRALAEEEDEEEIVSVDAADISVAIDQTDTSRPKNIAADIWETTAVPDEIEAPQAEEAVAADHDDEISEPESEDIADPWELYDIEHPTPDTDSSTNMNDIDVSDNQEDNAQTSRRPRHRRSPLNLGVVASTMEDEQPQE
jgi:hypothetical protein